MKEKIGIIGVGVVGEAVKYGMEKLGHEVYVHDLKLNSKIEDVQETDICFICVPTPSKKSLEGDISIVNSVLEEFHRLNYKGIIAIKSTVPPNTTVNFQRHYENERICFVPEFLRERYAKSDFIENHDVLVVGSKSEEISTYIKYVHGDYPKNVVYLSPTEAEIVKYYNNVYAATLVTLANNFYEVCSSSNADYSKVLEAFIKRDHIRKDYLDCNDDLRGYAGPCLPKDVQAMMYFCKKSNIDAGIFEFLDEENKNFKPTVMEDMRKE